MNAEMLQFGRYLTGLDEPMIRKLYEDWRKIKKVNKPCNVRNPVFAEKTFEFIKANYTDSKRFVEGQMSKMESLAFIKRIRQHVPYGSGVGNDRIKISFVSRFSRIAPNN